MCDMYEIVSIYRKLPTFHNISQYCPYFKNTPDAQLFVDFSVESNLNYLPSIPWFVLESIS